MLDLLKFDIGARNRASGILRDVKGELGGIKGALSGVNDYARRTGRSMRNIGAGMTAGVTAPLVLFGKQAVQLYDQQVQAETAVAQAIQSTGGAANKTLSDLKGLASGLQAVTTIGDEDILRNVTAPLLTFTKIQDEVFDRAQANVLDMATFLKMDLKSAAILSGKALNDPVKGLSALSRSGIQFTDSQKEVIKSLVETGDVAAAQSLILKELETQFGGQAKAAAESPLGQWRGLAGAIGDVKEQLGEQIVPFLTPLAKSVADAVSWFGKLSPEVKKNIVVVGGLAAAIGPLVMVIGVAVMGLTSITSALAAMGAALLANPIIAVIAAIAGGAYLIYRNWDGISGWFSGVWSRVKSVTSAAWAGIKALLAEYSPEWLKTLWGNLGTWFAIQWDAVRGSVIMAWDGIKALFSGDYSVEMLVKNAWAGLGDWFAGLGPTLTTAFVTLWESIKEEVSQWPARFIEIGSQIVDGLKQGILDKWNGMTAWFGGLIGQLTGTARDELDTHSPSRVFWEIGRDVVDGLGLGIAENKETALAQMKGLADGVIKEGERASGFMQDFESGLRGLFKTMLTDAGNFKSKLASTLSGWGNKLIDGALNTIFDSIFGFAKGGVISGGKAMAFADGGVVNSPTFFPMKGGTGLMGEAGPEAILPLARGPGGKLGVRAGGGQGSGTNVQLNFSPVIDARGADQAAVTRLAAELQALQASFENRVHAAVQTARMRRVPGVVGI